MSAARQAKLQRRWKLWSQRADRESHAINAWLQRRELARRDDKELPDACPERTVHAYTDASGTIALAHAQRPRHLNISKGGRVYVRKLGSVQRLSTHAAEARS